jgi:hypothetical protein
MVQKKIKKKHHDRLFELYKFCSDYAKKKKKNIFLRLEQKNNLAQQIHKKN